MAGTIKAGTITDGSSSVSVDAVCRGTSKAWITFVGTGTIATLNSFNVSSIVDNAVGKYTLNFITPMKHTNYGCTGSGVWSDANYVAVCVGQALNMPRTLSSMQIGTSNTTSGQFMDAGCVFCTIYGD